MLHKRIISPVITALDKERAAYFGRVVDRLEQDPRSDLYPNLPVLVLKETVELLPIYLEPTVLVNHLFRFLERKHESLSRVIHSAPYVADNSVLKSHCVEFVESVIRDTFENVSETDQDVTDRKEYRLKWPISPEEFPYTDDTDFDENE